MRIVELVLAISLSLVLAAPAGAMSQREKEKMIQLSNDFLSCAAFYTVTAQAAKESSNPILSANAGVLKTEEARALMYAMVAAKALDEDDEATRSRYSGILDSVITELGRDALATYEKYKAKCNALLDTAASKFKAK